MTQSVPKRKRKSISYAKYGYFFIAPFFLIYLVFQAYPLVNTIYLAFQKYMVTGTNKVSVRAISV